jgi:glycerol dehydrogenase-like iron-containing ADH family enzyme
MNFILSGLSYKNNNFFAKYTKVFIITGKNSFYKTKLNKVVVDIFKEKKIFVFLKKKKIPELSELKKIILNMNKFQPDLILGIGGGSVIDYSKLSNVLVNEKNIEHCVMRNIVSKKKRCDLVIFPTTAGSGSESTNFSVIYIKNNKFSLESKLMKPKEVFFYPKVLLKLPQSIRASSGFDAIAQSVESIFSLKSNSKSISFARKSLKILFSNYLNFVLKPNLKNSKNMFIGSNLSGKAINISKTNAPHAVSYPFTSLFGINHGHAVSLNFLKFMKCYYLKRFNSISRFSINDRFLILFNLLKVSNFSAFNKFFIVLLKKVKLEQDLKKLGINPSQYKKIISYINDDRLSNSPVYISRKIAYDVIFSD